MYVSFPDLHPIEERAIDDSGANAFQSCYGSPLPEIAPISVAEEFQVLPGDCVSPSWKLIGS